MAAERKGCISFVLDFLFLFDQAKRKVNIEGSFLINNFAA